MTSIVVVTVMVVVQAMVVAGAEDTIACAILVMLQLP